MLSEPEADENLGQKSVQGVGMVELVEVEVEVDGKIEDGEIEVPAPVAALPQKATEEFLNSCQNHGSQNQNLDMSQMPERG